MEGTTVYGGSFSFSKNEHRTEKGEPIKIHAAPDMSLHGIVETTYNTSDKKLIITVTLDNLIMGEGSFGYALDILITAGTGQWCQTFNIRKPINENEEDMPFAEFLNNVYGMVPLLKEGTDYSFHLDAHSGIEAGNDLLDIGDVVTTNNGINNTKGGDIIIENYNGTDPIYFQIFTKCGSRCDPNDENGCTILCSYGGGQHAEKYKELIYERIKFNEYTLPITILPKVEKPSEPSISNLTAYVGIVSGRGARVDFSWDSNDEKTTTLTAILYEDATEEASDPLNYIKLNLTEGITKDADPNEYTNREYSNVKFSCFTTNQIINDQPKKIVNLFWTNLKMGTRYKVLYGLYCASSKERIPKASREYLTIDFDTYGTQIKKDSLTSNAIICVAHLTKPNKTIWGNNIKYRCNDITNGFNIFPNDFVNGNTSQWVDNGSNPNIEIKKDTNNQLNIQPGCTYQIQCIADGVTAVTGTAKDKDTASEPGVELTKNDTVSEVIVALISEEPQTHGGGGGGSTCTAKITGTLIVGDVTVESSAHTIGVKLSNVKFKCTDIDEDWNLSGSCTITCNNIEKNIEGITIPIQKPTDRELDGITISCGFTGLDEGTQYTISISLGGTFLHKCTHKDISSKMDDKYVYKSTNPIYTRSNITTCSSSSRAIIVSAISKNYQEDKMNIYVYKSGTNKNNSAKQIKVNSGSYLFDNLIHNTSYVVNTEIDGCYAFDENGERTPTNDSTKTININTKEISFGSFKLNHSYQHALVYTYSVHIDGKSESIDDLTRNDIEIISSNDYTFAQPIPINGYLSNQIKDKGQKIAPDEDYSSFNNNDYNDEDNIIVFDKLPHYYCKYKVQLTATDGFNKVSSVREIDNTEFPYVWLCDDSGNWHRYMSYIYNNNKWVPAPLWINAKDSKNSNLMFVEANGDPLDAPKYAKYSRTDYK